MIELLHTPLFSILLTLVCYRLGEWVYAKSQRFPLCHPFIIALPPLTWGLYQAAIDFDTYLEHTTAIHFWLGPATVALAWPLYRQLTTIGQHWRGIAIATVLGALVAMFTAVGIAALLKAPAEVVGSLASKSITTPIAIEIVKHSGGYIALAAGAVAFTGIFGAVVAPPMMTALGIEDPRVRGFTLGLVAHAIGTARAFEEGEQAGAFASLALSLTGITTALLLPWLWPLIKPLLS